MVSRCLKGLGLWNIFCCSINFALTMSQGRMRNNWCHRVKHSFSTLALSKFGARWFFVLGDRLLHCKMLTIISSHYPLDDGSISSQLWQPKASPDIAKCPTGGRDHITNTGLRALHSVFAITLRRRHYCFQFYKEMNIQRA